MDVNYKKNRGGQKINLLLFCAVTRCTETPKVMHFLMLDMESSVGGVELLPAARQINQYTVSRGPKGISAELANSPKKKLKFIGT